MRCVWPSAERDADKTGHPDTGWCGHLHRQICLDRPVLKLRVFEEGENAILRFISQNNSFATLIFDCLGVAAGEDESIGVSQGEALERLGGRVCITGLLRICSQDCRDGTNGVPSLRTNFEVVVMNWRRALSKGHLVRQRTITGTMLAIWLPHGDKRYVLAGHRHVTRIELHWKLALPVFGRLLPNSDTWQGQRRIRGRARVVA